MILVISKVYDREFTENTTKLGTHMLKLQSTHLFIASNNWDEIEIELDDCIPANSLLHFNMVTDTIKVRLPEEINQNTVKQLVELFPDKAGVIRKCYMTGGDLRGVLDCVV